MSVGVVLAELTATSAIFIPRTMWVVLRARAHTLNKNKPRVQIAAPHVSKARWVKVLLHVPRQILTNTEGFRIRFRSHGEVLSSWTGTLLCCPACYCLRAVKKATQASQKGHVNGHICHKRTGTNHVKLPWNTSSWCNTAVLKGFSLPGKSIQYSPTTHTLSTHFQYLEQTWSAEWELDWALLFWP